MKYISKKVKIFSIYALLIVATAMYMGTNVLSPVGHVVNQPSTHDTFSITQVMNN